MKTLFAILMAVFLALPASLAAEPPVPKFRAVTIDDKIQIGYGVAVADVDGDGRPDILLADKKQFVWYRNPTGDPQAEEGPWEKFLIAENLTKQDNVCLAAQDIDGDGKCELAIGAEWNPGDTENSGAVFYLIAPEDRTQRWTPVKLHAEPTTHRMRWIKLEEPKPAPAADPANPSASFSTVKIPWGLVVLPLHGRGNKNGEGAPVKVLLYHPPKPLNDPAGKWKTELIDESMHMTHNFEVHSLPDWWVPSVLIGGKEGLIYVYRDEQKWRLRACVGTLSDLDQNSIRVGGTIIGGRMAEDPPCVSQGGVGEVRIAKGIGKWPILAAVEPMHGNNLVIYDSGFPTPSGGRGLTSKLTEGHALACGDLLGVKSDQIVVGWRGTPGKEGSTTGVAVWTPLDEKGEKWRETMVDPDGMACEDLQLADLNGDGKLDIVASGRATRNVKIYFNETP